MNSLFVIAMQRSGSNALRYALTASGHFADHNEVFAPQHMEGEFSSTSFWNFKQKHVEPFRRPFLRLGEHRQMWKMYLDHVEKQYPDDPVHIFDIKTNSLHQFDGAVWNILDKPALLTFLGESKANVIHLQRQNLVEMFASTMRGVRTGKWVVRTEEAKYCKHLIQQELTLPVPNLLRYISEKELENLIVSNWVRSLEESGAKVLRLNYENLFAVERQTLSDSSALAITELLGLPPCTGGSLFPLRTIKMMSPLAECVTNYRTEVVPALRKAGYEKYL